MEKWKKGLERRIGSREAEAGVTVVEYAVMLVLIALVVAAFGLGINGSITGVFSRVITFLVDGS